MHARACQQILPLSPEYSGRLRNLGRGSTLCPNHPDASAHVADDEAKRFADALFVAVCFCRSVASAMALPSATTTRSGESVKTVAAAAIANTASASAGFAHTCLASRVLQPFLVRDLSAFCCARLVHFVDCWLSSFPLYILHSGAASVEEWISACTTDAKGSVRNVEARKSACITARNFAARTASCESTPLSTSASRFVFFLFSFLASCLVGATFFRGFQDLVRSDI